MELIKDYRRYRWFFTSTGKLVVGGKSALQNEELLKKLKSIKLNLIVMHTNTPGSPFAAILSTIDSVTKEDLEETATFTGCFSRAWRAQKKETTIDIFKLSQLRKSKLMKAGTWGVKGEIERRNVKLELSLIKQKETLRAVPNKTANTKKIYARIKPGKIDKTKMVAKIQKLVPKSNKDEILSALPPGGVSIK